jgi:adenylate kinase
MLWASKFIANTTLNPLFFFPSIRGGNVLDYHSSDFFPERWFQLVLPFPHSASNILGYHEIQVICLRTDNTVLFGRLEKRGYHQEKISENIDAEIHRVVLNLYGSSFRF